ncbi:MAG: hypothetical protein IJ444_04570 [Kiritimatiellae bacterium]|nr:hypothetical protein [Kiritimatiellia bacterium]
MNKLKFTLTTILLLSIATALYFYFMAPIGKCFTKGIPYTSYVYGTEQIDGEYKIKAIELVQGDHLQLQYHFDLFSKMLKGDIPAFHNLYEFNTGSDADRKIIDPYYIPFSFIYAIGQTFSTDAFAWNFSQLISAICSLIFLYCLVRRFAASETLQITCIAIAIIAMSVPYRWVNLAAGSPTGFGMGLVPGVFLGIDLAVRGKRLWGGILAGALIFLLYCTDLHCFVFSVLATPGFCIVSWLYKAENWKALIPSKKDCVYLTKNLIAIPIAGLCAMFFALRLRASYTTTDVAGGRTLAELKINSPVIDSLVDYAFPCHGAMHFNIGWILTALIAFSCIVSCIVFISYLIKLRTRPIAPNNERSDIPNKLIPIVTALLLCFAICLAIVLALGTNGPIEGLPLRAIRKLLPPYQMIRQPVKIFCLLPTLLAPLLILVWNCFNAKCTKLQYAKGMILFAIVLLSLIFAREGMWCGISLLPEKRQEAYKAAVEEANTLNKTPRALILPIWPGDSSWSSIYEYHTMRNDLRMLNGYSPVKSFDYVDDIFGRYETITHGIITEDNFSTLKNKHSVSSIIIHENAFPDKVSPLPVGYTLKQFIKNPQLKFLKHERDAWSFSLFPENNASGYIITDKIPQTLCPARLWYFDKRSNGAGLTPATFNEKGNIPYILRRPAADATNKETWLTLDEELALSGNVLDCSYLTNAYHRAGMWIASTPEPQKLSFVSGGIEVPAIQLKDRYGNALPLAAAPIGSTETNGFVSVEIKGTSPIHTTAYMPVLDLIDPRESPRTIAASDLFHAGYTATTINNESKTISFDAVVLEPQHAPAGKVIYGPNLPIIGGTWNVEIIFSKDSPKIGNISVHANGTQIAEGPANIPLSFTAKNCDFICIYYDYPDKNQTVTINAIMFSSK